VHTQLTHSKKSKAWSMTAHGYKNQDPNAGYVYFSSTGILCSIWFIILFHALSPTKTTIINPTISTSSLEEKETLYLFCSWWNFTVEQLRKIQPNKVSLPSLSVSTEEWLHLPSSHDLLHPIGNIHGKFCITPRNSIKVVTVARCHHSQMGLLWKVSTKFPNRQVNKYCNIA
jgi:hypothetical protein